MIFNDKISIPLFCFIKHKHQTNYLIFSVSILLSTSRIMLYMKVKSRDRQDRLLERFLNLRYPQDSVSRELD